MLNSDRITLRPLKIDDYSFFFKWLNDTLVTNFIGFHLPKTEMEEKKWIEGQTQKATPAEILFIIELKNENRPIGFCVIGKINYKDRNGELMLVIGEPEYWGKGLGTEAGKMLTDFAFNQLNLHKLHTGVYKFNKRSLRSIKKLGFKKEGCQRQAVFKNGDYHDIIMFGLIRKKGKT